MFIWKVRLTGIRNSVYEIRLGNRKCRGFCQGISMFFSICLSKEINLIAEAIKFWGILTKKCVSKNKKVFLFKKEKRNVSLNKKRCFCLSHDFQTWFHKADYLLYSVFMLLLVSYTSFGETEHRNNANPSLFI